MDKKNVVNISIFYYLLPCREFTDFYLALTFIHFEYMKTIIKKLFGNCIITSKDY